jgi:hypothetical protein
MIAEMVALLGLVSANQVLDGIRNIFEVFKFLWPWVVFEVFKFQC